MSPSVEPPAPPPDVLTSRAYYDALSAEYDWELVARSRYVKAVNDLVVRWSQQKGARTILDIGCGNGARLREILSRTPLTGLGVDESVWMVAEARRRGIAARVMDISVPLSVVTATPERYDVITALWNVLGHIARREGRRQALANMRALLSHGGIIVLDVNNRYNARQYGWWRVGRNVVLDAIAGQRTGDFIVRREVGGQVHATKVHIFSRREILDLCREAGLRPLAVQPIDYELGLPTASQWQGQLCVTAEADTSG